MLARIRLLFSSVTVEDPMSGFFGGKTDFIKDILVKNADKLEPRGYKIVFDILKYLPEKSRLSGFYFHFGLREYDVSKFNPRLVCYFLRSLFR